MTLVCLLLWLVVQGEKLTGGGSLEQPILPQHFHPFTDANSEKDIINQGHIQTLKLEPRRGTHRDDDSSFKLSKDKWSNWPYKLFQSHQARYSDELYTHFTSY